MRSLIIKHIREMALTKTGKPFVKSADELFQMLFSDNQEWEREKPIPELNNNRIKFDCINFEDKVTIEYQGNHHYQVVSNIIRDDRKQKLAEEVGFTCIQYPYWLGIHPEYMNELFGGRIVNNLSHIPAGFISKQAVLPADFCEMGIKRFKDEFNGLPSHIQEEIKDSLKIKLEELKNINLVVPTSLEYLIV
jgi:hypothetical protein